MTIPRKLIIGGIGAVVLLAAFCTGRSQKPAISPAVQRTIDSLTFTHARDTVVIDSLRTALDTANTHATAAHDSAVASHRHIVKLHHAADSIASVAATHDTTPADSAAERWHAAYTARTLEADSLRVANAHLEDAYHSQVTATLAARAALALALQHDSATTRINAELAHAAQRAGRCTVVLHIPCPTRRQSFVAGALTGAVAAIAAIK